MQELSLFTPVLDHGFVKLVDWMGDDERICDAARVSLAAGRSFNDDDVKTPKQNKRLINYLLSHGHTSPFEQVEFTFVVQAPIFVVRQWHRHRTWSYNEISGRYTELPATKMYVPSRDKINHKSDSIKQGRGKPLEGEDLDNFLESLANQYGEVQDLYEAYTSDEPGAGYNVAREIARIPLPVATYTRMYAKVDLSNLLKFFSLRMKPNAQYEIRVYAQAMKELIEPIVPMAIAAWEEHVFHGSRLSRSETETLKELLSDYQGYLALEGLNDGSDERVKKMHKKASKILRKLGS